MQALFDDNPPSPCPSPFNLAGYVLAQAAQQPEKTALSIVTPDHADTWTYQRLERAVRGVASGLAAHGLSPGDRVLLRLGNTVDFPIAFLGAIAAGFVPVPTSAQLTAPEITKLAHEIEPAMVIAGPGVPLPTTDTPVITSAGLEAMFSLDPTDYAMGDPNRPAYMIYTSGTGGSPRGVVHAHRAVWARRLMWSGWYDLNLDDRLLHAGAFNWTYTLGTGLLDPWAAGATALIPGEGVSADQLPQLLEQYDATIFAAAPGVYRQILKTPLTIEMPSLRHGLSAGEKLPEATRQAWTNATGTNVYEALGMSECSTFISGSPLRPATAPASGYPQPGRRIAVLDEAFDPVERGHPGQLAVSSRDAGLMLGYWKAEEETKAKFHGEWFLTGDMVQMGEDGAIAYLGRTDDMMNAGGFRVSPVEVEAALTQHPDITEVAATEVQVKADTTVIAAFYTGAKTADENLQSFSAERLARYKQPRLFIHMDALPKGGNGKLNRRALRASWEAAHD
ncbi:class I adenylate-forming enzyme family protein [Actibacterium lipolyticum]|uniref:Benzoate--CoA ligase n=1 Tax=Actibacterium lipolyticum TaxID=1524263 RepID=A0A238JWM2_9RHOB|nr:class I adenylate-forming enzyme family protein [Actibacterium lipolyticum]SMX35068.1 Benzoate--CoA ligase [Actibacterium lipolyticum]